MLALGYSKRKCICATPPRPSLCSTTGRAPRPGWQLAGEGIPAVAAGPGDIAQVHTEDEWIEEEELSGEWFFIGNF